MSLRKPDGALLRCRVISRPRELPDGKLIWDGILIDITERKAAQEAAERTAALLGAVGDATLDNIYAKDRDCRFIYANAATGATLGRAPAALIGLSNLDVTSNREEAEIITANDLRVMSAGRTEVIEEVLTSGDGVTRIYRSAKAPMRDGSGAVIGLAGVSADITEQKQAQTALAEESRTLETLNRTGAALAGELDLERLVQMVTDAGVELTGAKFGAFFYNVLREDGERFMLYTLPARSVPTLSISACRARPPSSTRPSRARERSAPTISSSIRATARTRRIAECPRATCRSAPISPYR
jgi:PAS domain S-box-containing protein